MLPGDVSSSWTISCDVFCADVAGVVAMLTIHSCKAHLVSSLNLSTTCLADAIIQLAIAKGERHEVTGQTVVLVKCV